MISFVDEEQGTGLDLVTATETFFSESGLLSKAKNFEFRHEQQQMAVAVANALLDNSPDQCPCALRALKRVSLA